MALAMLWARQSVESPRGKSCFCNFDIGGRTEVWELVWELDPENLRHD